jgi:hypothetical protein
LSLMRRIWLTNILSVNTPKNRLRIKLKVPITSKKFFATGSLYKTVAKQYP